MISALHIDGIFLGSFFGCRTGVDVFVDGKISLTFLYSDALVTKNGYSVSIGYSTKNGYACINTKWYLIWYKNHTFSIFLNKNSMDPHSSRTNCKKEILKMKLCYISNFSQVAYQTKIKIVFHSKNHNYINIKYYIKVW